jgi:purine-nucleoside/S-methyl-5'-thioadenosine phosphorylase / adenosine deaminase
VSPRELMFALPGGGRALFTERADGNMSSVSGAGAQHGRRAREQLRERTGLARHARGRQVHGTVVRRVGPGEAPLDEGPAWEAPPGESLLEADGHATALPGLGVMVLTADCLPVALGSAGAVAMLHAGWRGLAAGVLEEGVRAVRDLGAGEEIVAVIGPGAGACCYEVGAEVHAALGSGGSGGSAAGHINLHAIARERLLAAGVSRVRDPGICTICDRAFFSHRREGARAGRQAGVAWLS